MALFRLDRPQRADKISPVWKLLTGRPATHNRTIINPVDLTNLTAGLLGRPITNLSGTIDWLRPAYNPAYYMT